MASGTIRLKSYRNAYGYIVWESTVSGAKSVVTATLVAGISTYTYAGQSGSLSVGGESASNDVGVVNQPYWSGELTVVTCTETVSHDSDGNASVYIGGSYKIVGGSYSGAVLSGGTTVTLDHIEMTQPEPTVPKLPARASGVDWDADIGGSLSIQLKANKAGLTHTVTYTFGNASGTICNKQGDGTYKLDIPYSFALEIPYIARGVLEVSCTTYNGSSAVGTKKVSAVLRLPENDVTRPKISAFSVEPVNDDIPADFAGLYIQGVTKIKASYTAASDYSQIHSYQLMGNGLNGGAGNPGIATPEYSGNLSVSGRVMDDRGFCRDTTAVDVYVHAYAKPSVAAYPGEAGAVCCRCDSGGNRTDNGIYLLLRAKKTCQSILVDGANKNACKLEYRIKASSAESFSGWVTLLDFDSGSDSISEVLADVVSDSKTSYDVELRVTDKMGAGPVLRANVATEEVTMHLKRGGRGVAFLGYAQKDGYVEVYGNLEVGSGKLLRMGDTDMTEEQLIKLLSMDILDKTYPVGTIYMSQEPTSPAELFGGTWEQLKDRFLLGAGDTYAAGTTGGSAEETLTVEQIPSHDHALMAVGANTPVAKGRGDTTIWPYYNEHDTYGQKTAATGGGEAHNNMPPYRTVYMWRRTA